MAWVWFVDSTRVCPSGSAFATCRAPIAPAPPPTFSTMAFWPSAPSSGVRRRASASTGPPAG